MKYARRIIFICIIALAAISLMAVKCSFVIDDIVLPGDVSSDKIVVHPGSQVHGQWKLIPNHKAGK